MFDPAKAKLILETVMLGLDPERAAIAHGIMPDEHARWIELGSAEPGSTALVGGPSALAAEYVRSLDIAVAQAELRALRSALDGSDAHKWFLERRFPEKWAKTPAAIRAEQLRNGAPSPEDEADGVVPESRMEQARREREERNRAAAGDDA